MLVHPEISAILNRLSQSERDDRKNGPRVTRGDKSSNSGQDKPKSALAYAAESVERKDEVDYLNQKESKLSRYA
jgi:hypothetical protein